MKLLKLLFILGLLATVFLSVTAAQEDESKDPAAEDVADDDDDDDDDDDNDDEDILDQFDDEEVDLDAALREDSLFPASSPDIVVRSMFSTHMGTVFGAGDEVEFLVNVENVGARPYNVSGMFAQFLHPQDRRFAVQNFSYVPFNQVVAPKSEITVQYRLKTHESFESIDLGLQGTLFYTDIAEEPKMFSTTFFNETVSIVEGGLYLDGEGFVKYFGGLSVLLAIGYFVLRMNNSKKQPVRQASGTTGKIRNISDGEYLSDLKHHLQPQSATKKGKKRD